MHPMIRNIESVTLIAVMARFAMTNSFGAFCMFGSPLIMPYVAIPPTHITPITPMIIPATPMNVSDAGLVGATGRLVYDATADCGSGDGDVVAIGSICGCLCC